MAVQWLRIRASNAGGMGSIPGWGAKILHVTQYGKENKNKRVGGFVWKKRGSTQKGDKGNSQVESYTPGLESKQS